MQIEITDVAKEELEKIMKEKNTDKHLKIYVAGHGWGGPSFGMALEEPEEDALNVQADGYNFIIDEGLEDLYSKFTVDYSDSMLKKGFTILPTRI